MPENFKLQLGPAELVGECKGTGDAIIFLHAGVADRRMWAQQLEEFKQTHKAIAYDRRGFGKTTTADVPFRHVDDLAAVLDQHNVEKAIICGCSQGAKIAIDFSLAHPKRTSSLILVSAVYTGAPWEERNERESALARQIDHAEDLEELETVNQLEAHAWLDGPSSSKTRANLALRELFLDMNRIALLAPELTNELAPAPAGDMLSKIECPTLLIEGDLDFEMINEHHRTLKAAIKDSLRIVVPGTAHLPSMEEPEIFNAHVREFLSSQ